MNPAVDNAPLAAEYQHLAESLLRNEEAGEKRVNIFLLLAGAAGTAGSFARGPGQLSPATTDPLLLATLAVLFGFGYTTMLRLIHRNLDSDRFRVGLSRLREQLLQTSPDLKGVVASFYTPTRHRHISLIGFGKGGWLETVILLEAVLAGAAGALVAATGSWWRNMGWGVAVAVTVWVGLVLRANAAYDRRRVV